MLQPFKLTFLDCWTSTVYCFRCWVTWRTRSGVISKRITSFILISTERWGVSCFWGILTWDISVQISCRDIRKLIGAFWHFSWIRHLKWRCYAIRWKISSWISTLKMRNWGRDCTSGRRTFRSWGIIWVKMVSLERRRRKTWWGLLTHRYSIRGRIKLRSLLFQDDLFYFLIVLVDI